MDRVNAEANAAFLTALRRKAPNPWAILTLWREGFDTYDIAKQLGVQEHEVSNRLMHIREKSGARHG